MNSLILKPKNLNIFFILRRFSTSVNLPTNDKKNTRDIKIPELKKDKEKRYVKDNLIEGFYNCQTMYLNNINDYFQVNERTQNIFIAHICEFINTNIDLFTSFTMKDNTIWKEFKNNFIIFLC